eukprot:6179034-Pleurochrysis_carterae.AAC.1
MYPSRLSTSPATRSFALTLDKFGGELRINRWNRELACRLRRNWGFEYRNEKIVHLRASAIPICHHTTGSKVRLPQLHGSPKKWQVEVDAVYLTSLPRVGYSFLEDGFL